jgi:RimJ/RimL family protein N-acetyltransferase
MHIYAQSTQHGEPIGLDLPSRETPRLPDRSNVLTGSYCRLEPLDADKHVADLFAGYQLDTTGQLWTYIPNGPYKAEAELRAWAIAAQEKADPFFYAIIDLKTNKAVGIASYLRIDPVNHSIEVGWITYTPLMQRSPISTEAMFLMMKQAFDMGYRRYEWKCNALNAPSISAAMRLGMTFEGLFRQMNMPKGQNRDTAWFAIIDKDWPVAQAAFEKWLAPENFDADGTQKTALSDLTSSIVYDRWPTLTVKVEQQ